MSRIVILVLLIGTVAPVASAAVHVNQVGYAPGDAKWAAVPQAAAGFEVIRTSDGSTVLTGPVTLRRAADPASGDDVHVAEFSSLTTPGEYRVRVPGAGDSPTFLIHEGVWDDLYRRLLRGLSSQRCGATVYPVQEPLYAHDACHDEAGGIASHDWSTTGGPPGGYRNTIGGWHDAGDYGKYATNNGYAVGILLQAYSGFPARYAHDDCGIPESGNGVPDLLDEARWSLEWMLTMQDPGGGVRHREAVATWSGEFIPENDLDTRYYTDVSSDATAAHGAAMALAARVYAAIDPVFAAACSTSAEAAWGWLQANPGRVPAGGFVNLYGHTGATYAGSEDVGHRIWAAAERLALTGDPAAAAYIDANWGDGLAFNGVWYPDSWGALANVGAFAYRDAPGATPATVSGSWWSVENSVLGSSATWTARVANDGYACAATTTDYYWGFTGVILRYAWTLIQGFRYGGDPAHEQAAMDQLHYILGRNPMGKTYLTGLGSNPVLHSHGAWNLAAGFVDLLDANCRPIPYQLVGGPNAADNGHLSPYPGRCYEDIADPAYFNKGNWTLNETAVNIQTALIALVGYFSSGGTVTGVPGDGDGSVTRIPAAFPNPFVGAAELLWSPPAGNRGLRLALVDATGRTRRTWFLDPGEAARGRLLWDGRDAAGRPLAGGVYFLAGDGIAAGGRVVKLR